ncbi:hypothetical protein GCM10010306_062130 [Streptomyces umbrinus]|nr:hypothetical protein GCM10010306_062130 [Streptomyces umbrinus]
MDATDGRSGGVQVGAQRAGGGGEFAGRGVPVAEGERLDVAVTEPGQALKGAGLVGRQGFVSAVELDAVRNPVDVMTCGFIRATGELLPRGWYLPARPESVHVRCDREACPRRPRIR